MSTVRPLAEVARHPRLPVWPVWNGVACWAAETVGLRGVAAGMERRTGGRVTPMQLDPQVCDPFLMVVHHRHSFARFDPLRPLSALVMPEGFPAHPHRGFETVTYVLEGAMRHRDSTGIKMVYRGESAQWLTAGRGVLHEEMWAHEGHDTHELYQIWVNLPRAHKMDPPRIQVVGAADIANGGVSHAPLPVGEVDGVRLTVLSGACRGVRSPVHTHSPMALVHASFPSPATFTWDDVPADHTVLLHVRRGAVSVGGRRIDAHHLARFERAPGALVIEALEADTHALILTGAPLREPVAMGGAFVMSTNAEVAAAQADFQAGRFGIPWSPSLPDEAWLAGLRR